MVIFKLSLHFIELPMPNIDCISLFLFSIFSQSCELYIIGLIYNCFLFYPSSIKLIRMFFICHINKDPLACPLNLFLFTILLNVVYCMNSVAF